MNREQKLKENEIMVNQKIISFSMKLLLINIFMIVAGYIYKYSPIIVASTVILLSTCCLAPYIYNKVAPNSSKLKYFSIITFVIIISVIYFVGGRVGLTLFYSSWYSLFIF
jgi:hypothetical protein